MEEVDIFTSNRMTNDDFRKLLKTPRASVPAATPDSVPGTVRDASAKTAQTPVLSGRNEAELRRKKKSVYAKLKKQEDDKMAELAEKYRDRARERRLGMNQDQDEDPMTNASAYRAVAADLKSNLDAAERRRQMIQQSKFLGGDMKHTHLVKGLDYALLQKVRSEIEATNYEQEIEMEKLVKPKEKVKEKKEPEKKNEEMPFKTKMGRNIYKILTVMKSTTVERNELFTPGRMAYVIDLDDENAETDIPTTLIRSKADVPAIDNTLSLTTNDIVINKLAQIFSYLRQGSRHGKKGKKNKDIRSSPEDFNEVKLAPKERQDDSIYGDIGDYVATLSKSDSSQKKKKEHSYFGKPLTDFNEKDNAPRLPSSSEAPTAVAVAKVVAISDAMQEEGTYFLVNPAAEPEGYAECYVGMEEMQDAIDDSDDETDYTKMDREIKKGPIGRRDFDTAEEYGEYKNNAEALPNGRGIKKYITEKNEKRKNEKAKLDREFKKIRQIISKRKSTFGDGGPEFKVLRC